MPLDPVALFFLLGLAGRTPALRPQALYETLAIYLLLSIGLRAGWISRATGWRPLDPKRDNVEEPQRGTDYADSYPLGDTTVLYYWCAT